MCMNGLGGIIIYYILIRVYAVVEQSWFFKPNLLQLVL